MATCDVCRLQSACLKSIHFVVSSRPVVEPPSDLRMRIAQAIAAERPPVRPVRRIGFAYGALAGAAACALGGAYLFSMGFHTPTAVNPAPSKVKTIVALKPAPAVVNSSTTKRLHIQPPKTMPESVKPPTSEVANANDALPSNGIKRHMLDVLNNQSTKMSEPAFHVQSPTSPTDVSVKRIVPVHGVVAAVQTPATPKANEQTESANRTVVASSKTDAQSNGISVPTPHEPTPAPSPAVVVAATTESQPVARTADFLGAVTGHLSASGELAPNKQARHQIGGDAAVDTPYRALDKHLEGNSGIVNLVGSNFN